MRVARRETLTSILVLSMFIVTMTFVPDVVLLSRFSENHTDTNDSLPEALEYSPLIEDMESIERNSGYSIISSDSPVDGILNPVLVEQAGYAASANISARTDTRENLDYDLPLDVAHNWTADEAEVTVWNLEKLYAVNGSFNEGYPGITQFPNGSVEYY
ncbi:MAG: hypothetical protein ACFFCT_12475, partial [Candidatus Odinarchaeota archaeon]